MIKCSYVPELCLSLNSRWCLFIGIFFSHLFTFFLMFNLHSLLGNNNSCVPPKTLCVCIPCSFLHWIPPGCIQCGSVDYLGSASGPAAAAGREDKVQRVHCARGGGGGGGGRSPGFLGRQPFSQLIIPRLAPARRSSTAAQSRSFPSTHVNRLRTFSFFFTSHLKGEKLFNMKKLFFFFPPYTATVASVQGCRWKRLYQRVKCKWKDKRVEECEDLLLDILANVYRDWSRVS